MQLNAYLPTASQVLFRQIKENIEFIGFEGRNKFEICAPDGQVLARAEERKQGISGALVRQVLRHWRPFTIDVSDPSGAPILSIRHPFRFYFQRLEVTDAHARAVGAMQKQFSIFSKRFVIESGISGAPIEMCSGFFKVWTFPFTKSGVEVASLQKKWGGALREIFTDADSFLLEFKSPALTLNERLLLVAAALFVDLEYFEENKGSLASLIPG